MTARKLIVAPWGDKYMVETHVEIDAYSDRHEWRAIESSLPNMLRVGIGTSEQEAIACLLEKLQRSSRTYLDQRGISLSSGD